MIPIKIFKSLVQRYTHTSWLVIYSCLLILQHDLNYCKLTSSFNVFVITLIIDVEQTGKWIQLLDLLKKINLSLNDKLDFFFLLNCCFYECCQLTNVSNASFWIFTNICLLIFFFLNIILKYFTDDRISLFWTGCSNTLL